MTVSFPRGRWRSIPLRLFWRAPRISMQPRSGGAVTHGFSAVVEPTVDYPIARSGSQISRAKSHPLTRGLLRVAEDVFDRRDRIGGWLDRDHEALAGGSVAPIRCAVDWNENV